MPKSRAFPCARTGRPLPTRASACCPSRFRTPATPAPMTAPTTCYQQLLDHSGALCIFGHNLGPQDSHLVQAIRQSATQTLAISIYPRSAAFIQHQKRHYAKLFEGQVEVDFMNERVILNRGDALHFNAQKPPRIRSVGDEQAQLLVVVH
ncbi:DUF4917 family protein, partial [Pseudomonas protegens]|uniref:cupin domain-containing protein n=1 Tax=Pseudomonas protegens TaxID=380021 RepID=UPI003D1381DA